MSGQLEFGRRRVDDIASFRALPDRSAVLPIRRRRPLPVSPGRHCRPHSAPVPQPRLPGNGVQARPRHAAAEQHGVFQQQRQQVRIVVEDTGAGHRHGGKIGGRTRQRASAREFPGDRRRCRGPAPRHRRNRPPPERVSYSDPTYPCPSCRPYLPSRSSLTTGVEARKAMSFEPALSGYRQRSASDLCGRRARPEDRSGPSPAPMSRDRSSPGRERQIRLRQQVGTRREARRPFRLPRVRAALDGAHVRPWRRCRRGRHGRRHQQQVTSRPLACRCGRIARRILLRPGLRYLDRKS